MTTHPNRAILAALYKDLTTISHYTAEDVTLHPATRTVDSTAVDIVGREAVLAWEQKLVEATNGTLRMDVEHITTNNDFGTVLGTFQARFGQSDFSQAFCGLWRFRDGRIVEHWENIYDPRLLFTHLSTKT